MSWAVAVEPVKETRGTSGWPTRASPAFGPVPNTMLTTPGGTPADGGTGNNGMSHAKYCRYAADAVVIPACCINLHIIQEVTEVISLGLATTVFPVAIAGAIFQVSRYRGKFQGLIRPAAHSNDTTALDTGPKARGRRDAVQTGGALTHSHGTADGVVEAALEVHLAAVSGVVQDGRGKEAEVVHRAWNVHSSCKTYGFTCNVTKFFLFIYMFDHALFLRPH